MARSAINMMVSVDIDDIADELTASEAARLANNVAARSKIEPDAREVVSRAVTMIRTGRVIDGVTLLEREFFPTWKDVAACEEAYRQAMALKAAA